MTWLLDNFETIFAIWGMLVAFCTAIVKITPTEKENRVLEKIVKWADVFSVVFTKEDAAKLAAATKKSKK